MKSWLVLLFAGLVCLHASPDAFLSYFTVSTHQPQAGQPVTVKIYLKDKDGQASVAQNVIVKTDMAGDAGTVCVLKAKGRYTGTVTLPAVGLKANVKVVADGVEILENLMPGGGDLTRMGHYHQNRAQTCLELTDGVLRMTKLSDQEGSGFFLGKIEGPNLLHDRTYIASIFAKYQGITGKGVCLTCGQYGQDEKSSGSTLYGKWYNGDGERELNGGFVPAAKTNRITIYSIIFAGDGIADFSRPRVQVQPTLISQDTPGIRCVLENAPAVFSNADDYLPAAIDGLADIWDLPENQDLHPALGRKLSAVEAWHLRQALYERQKQHEAGETAELLEAMRQGSDEEIEVEVSDEPEYGAEIRAMYFVNKTTEITVDGSLDEWTDCPFSTNFTALSPKRKHPADKVTKVYACYDETALYLAVRCEGTPEVTGTYRPKDDAEMWHCDVVEFFFGNSGDRGYRQFAVGPAGQLYDGDTSDGMVNFPWQGKSKVEDNGWNVEIALPWTSLGYDTVPEELLMNICRTATGREVSCWSLANKGFAERESMGFLLRDGFPYGADEAEHMAIRNQKAYEIRKAEAEQAARVRANLKGGQNAVLTAWDEMRDFEKSPNFQVRFLFERLKSSEPQQLELKQAVNEFAHAGFIVSAQAAASDISVKVSPLRTENGEIFPADGVKLYRILYLEPDQGLWPEWYDRWSKRPLPELVEEFEGTLALAECESSPFRLYLDSRNAIPGTYTGQIELSVAGQVCNFLPVKCEVMPFEITPCQELPFEVAIFSQIPYGGKSGEAWAKLFQEHYISIVDFEHYQVYVNGELSQSPGWAAENYIQDMCAYKLPEGAKVTFDGKLYDIDDRIAICARYGLMPIMTNRTGSIWPELMPALSEHLQSLGIKPDKWIYKLGDEDHSPWFVPLAQKIREYLPETPLACIPAGNEYWDLRELARGFNRIIFSRAAMTIDAEGEKHLREMQAQGVILSRYTNDTSWAERTAALSGRRDLWDVMIKDRMDGFQIWTAGLYPQLNFGLGYSSAYKVPAHDYPPEHQTTCQLVYVRREGDFYKPVSCIRLEDMRDGIIDTLYYREARRRLEAADDTNGLKRLEQVIAMPKKTPADFRKVREVLADLILSH